MKWVGNFSLKPAQIVRTTPHRTYRHDRYRHGTSWTTTRILTHHEDVTRAAQLCVVIIAPPIVRRRWPLVAATLLHLFKTMRHCTDRAGKAEQPSG